MFKRINIEISNICNLKCSFCPDVDRPKQIMGVEDFALVLDKVAPHTEEIVPHLLGEPLNHPDLEKILNETFTKRQKVNLTTNGVLLTESKSHLLLHPALRQVNFSLQSFEDNFKDTSPSIYLKRIKNFCDRAFEQRPDLYVNLRFWDRQIPGFSTDAILTDLQSQIGEIFNFDWNDIKIDLRRKKSWRLENRLYLHFDSRFEWPRLDAEVKSTQGFCHGLTGHIGIHSDGSVVPCCLDDKGILKLGNIFEQDLQTILTSERAQNMLEGFARGELREELCQRCDYVTRFGKKAKRISKSQGNTIKR